MPSFSDCFGSPTVIKTGWPGRYIPVYPLTVRDVGSLLRIESIRQGHVTIESASIILWLSAKGRLSSRRCRRLCMRRATFTLNLIKSMNPGLLEPSEQPPRLVDPQPPLVDHNAPSRAREGSSVHTQSESLREKKKMVKLGEFIRGTARDAQILPQELGDMSFVQFLTVCSDVDPEMRHIKTLKDWSEYWEEKAEEDEDDGKESV